MIVYSFLAFSNVIKLFSFKLNNKRQVQLLAEQETCTTIIPKGINYFVLIPEYICNILYITKLPAMNSSALIGGIFIKKNPLQDLLPVRMP